MVIQMRRVYEPPAPGDGYRVLIDRIWPRGVRKEEARLDAWLKKLAVSPELRRWFGHDPARWGEFRERYRRELRAPERRYRADGAATVKTQRGSAPRIQHSLTCSPPSSS